MSHIDDEVLAEVALGDGDVLGQSEQEHLQTCPTCRATLAELEEITAVGLSGRELLLTPEPALLDRITAEVADQPVATAQGSAGRQEREYDDRPALRSVGGAPPGPLEPAGREPRTGRSRRLMLLAAAVGLIVGVGGTLVSERLSRPDEQVLTSTTLSSLPGHTGGGRAELVVEDGVEKLRVAVDTASPGQDYRELWLINTDGKRMVSLGVLTASGRGSYPLPSLLSSGLQDYTIVDVSLEPFDGNSTHSRDSVVRGQLP